ncbi:MAG: malectin domain-containing carbohydrate-binding protein [Planctomycetota bacterium]|nr:malectin domain-containing carbohydrate-binding protein [Planctomycetota bacterium]
MRTMRFLAAAAVLLAGPLVAGDADLVIVQPKDASALETLAAREICRYVYVRTGKLLPIVAADAAPQSGGFVAARKDRPVVAALAADAAVKASVAALEAQQYMLKTVDAGGKRCVLVAGGDDTGTLYGAYRLAERLGVRFFMEGDVIPDAQAPLEVPTVDERGKPLFNLRGIQPFHDFPEGPDWWNLDDYKAIISQLAKLRMNFLGLHTYPEGGVGPEPCVWIGQPGDVDEKGAVQFAYPSSWMNTLRGNWGYVPKKTGDFVFGAAQLFEEDAYGCDVMRGHCPVPKTPEASKEVFERAGALLRDAVAHARSLGVKTCVGTETPLIVPRLVKQRLVAGKEPVTAAQVQSLYEGIFLRIARLYPVDYYWLWTPEDWTWSGVKDEQVQRTIDDLKLALAAAQKVKAPFTLATCGWVLGPPKDRAMFDNILPKEMPFSCINREVGKAPVEPGFAKVTDRPKWAIPWMEDDPNLCAPQLWAGRMRKDAVDALKYGCTGLFGIHWRTRILGPNVAALAAAAWDQSWGQPDAEPPAQARKEGPDGGQSAPFPNNRIAGTEDEPLYQTVRYDVAAYHFQMPNGKYAVTLKFCEPHYTEAGKRVFSVKLQGKQVIEKLDIFAKAGKDKALDYPFKDIEVTNGWLDIDFAPEVEFPSIAAIAVAGPGGTRKVNCGGPAYKDYAADWPTAGPGGGAPRNRFVPTDDFYLDWATASFGGDAGPAIGKVFARIDCHLPFATDWTDGPGGIKPDARAVEDVLKAYAFVDELEALRAQVKGGGSLERMDYWLNNFRYMKATERVKCIWAQSVAAMKEVGAQKDAAAKAQLAETKALPLRRQLVQAVAEVYKCLLPTVSTPGEMGTVSNWERHILPGLLTKPGQELAKALGKDLPADAQPSVEYAATPRLIVPTLRGSLAPGEALKLRAMVLDQKPPRKVELYWRVMGRGDFAAVPAANVARSVYRVELPAQDAAVVAVEYYVKAVTDGGKELVFPASAPAINQTAVVTK